MIVQIGDLVEGLCGNAELARKHCEDAVAFMKAQQFGVPMTVTKGNHDITGPRSVEAYDKFIFPFVAEGFDSDAPSAAPFTAKGQYIVHLF